MYQGWSGLWLDSLESNERILKRRWRNELAHGKLKFRRAMITPENVDRLLSEGGFHSPIDLLSLDIDGNDYHVWNATTVIKPRVVCIEYNAKFRPPVGHAARRQLCLERNRSVGGFANSDDQARSGEGDTRWSAAILSASTVSSYVKIWRETILLSRSPQRTTIIRRDTI